MARRIFGIETEYGVACTFQGQRRLSPDEVARYLFRKVVSWGRSSNVFLRNGSRLYLDVGSHPEYATAECDNVIDLIAHDRAGERIMEGLVVDAQERLRADDIEGDIYLFKNNTDSVGNSYGCHENYLVYRQRDFGQLANALLPFLITRQLVTGAGKVLVTPRGANFAFSQRADHMWEGLSSATTRSRPIINTRDEPHADAELYRRLHVIVGDSNMSQCTTMLKVEITVMVLDMLEAGVSMRDFSFDNPIRTIRQVSHDMTGRTMLTLANGRTMSSLEMQREYLGRVASFCRESGRDMSAGSVSMRALDLWARGLDAIESQNFSSIDTEIDWAIKLKLLNRYMEKNDLELKDPRIAQLDLTYHDIDRRRGLFYMLERAGMADKAISEVESFRAMSVPPQTTRAKLRGDFIAAAQDNERDFSVDWVHMKLNELPVRTVLCKDPFINVDERVENLIAHMER